MESYCFELKDTQFKELLKLYPNLGKNSHVGNLAVKIVELFFLSKYSDVKFTIGKDGADIEVAYEGKTERFEVKGTIDTYIAWSKLKVSSKHCYDSLVNGMNLIRVTGIGTTNMTLYFMKYNEDFTIVPEVRYAVKPLKKIR